MEQEIFKKIQEHYQQARRLLLHPESYEQAIELEAAQLFLNFLEGALQRPCNRIIHLEGFLSDVDGLMIQRMYPFAYFKDGILKTIQQLCLQVIKLAECYVILYPDKEHLLYAEPHELATE